MFRSALLFAALLLAFATAQAQSASSQDARSSSSLILLDAGLLRGAKESLAAPDSALRPAFDKLLEDADAALKAGPFHVMKKTLTPASGDKHDYLSLAPYSWPNPQKPDGLPYINRDGEINPEAVSDSNDHEELDRLSAAVNTLAHAYFFTGAEKYAAHAAVLLRAWFLDPATRMNPNLNYGQAIRGLRDGSGIGIIDTRRLLCITDATILLLPSTSWSAGDQRALREWFARYLEWLLKSKNGKDEAKRTNNHGTWYDVQVAVYALYAGRPEVARKVLEAAKARRIAGTIAPDGSQPRELTRTRSFFYSHYALQALLNLAWLGRHAGVDLAGYVSPEGASIRKALDAMLVYADPTRKWPHKEINGYHPEDLFPSALRAAILFQDAGLTQAARKLCRGEQRAGLIRLQCNQ